MNKSNNREILLRVDKFEGKRNCVLTMLIPPKYNFRLDTARVRRTIRSIKHKHKRRQLLRVMDVIWSHVKQYDKFKGNGMVICAGLNKKDIVEYFELLPVQKIRNFEYYYDDVFNNHRIMEFMYENVEQVSDQNKQSLVNKINTYMEKDQLVFHKKMNEYLETDLLSTVVYFSSENIPFKILDKCVSDNLKVLILSNKMIDNFIVKNNKFIGFIKYDMTFSQLHI